MPQSVIMKILWWPGDAYSQVKAKRYVPTLAALGAGYYFFGFPLDMSDTTQWAYGYLAAGVVNYAASEYIGGGGSSMPVSQYM